MLPTQLLIVLTFALAAVMVVVLGPTPIAAAAAAMLAGVSYVIVAAPRLFALRLGTRFITPYPDTDVAPVRVRRVYAHCREATGTEPQGVDLVTSRVELLAGPCWALHYESSLAHTNLGRGAKEAIALGVAEATGARIGAWKVMITVEAIERDHAGLAGGCRAWGAATARTDPQRAPRVDRDQMADAVGAAVYAHFATRVAQVLVADDTFSQHVNVVQFLYRLVAMPMTTRQMRKSLAIRNAAGASFGRAVAPSDPCLCSSDTPIHRVEEELPTALRTALAPSPHLLLACEAWSRDCARCVRAVLRKESRDILRKFVAQWQGGMAAASPHWAGTLAATSPHPEDRGLLGIALLLVTSPAQVSELDLMTAVTTRGDEAVVSVIAFAAAEAAKRVGERAAVACLASA